VKSQENIKSYVSCVINACLSIVRQESEDLKYREVFSYLVSRLQKNIRERCHVACYVRTTLKLSRSALSLTDSALFS